MADLYTRLKIDDSQYTKKLKEAEWRVKKFEDGAKSFGKGVIGGFTKMAAIAGVAGGAMETFDKFVNASQTTGDAWAGVVAQMKSSVDNFFYALNTGDFSGFSMGLERIRQQAQDTYDALDQLGNVRISYGYLGGKTDAEISKMRAIAMDESLTQQQRSEALAEWKSLVDNKKEMAINASEAAQDALYKMVAEGTMLDAASVTQEDYDRILALDLKNAAFRDKEKQQLEEQYEIYQKLNAIQQKRKDGNIYDDQGRAISVAKAEASIVEDTEKKQAELALQYKDAILYNKLLVKIKDEELEATVAIARESDAMLKNVYDNQNQLNRASKRVTNSLKATTKASKETAAQGSLQWYSDEINRLKKELQAETNVSVIAAIQKDIDALEAQKLRFNAEIYFEQHGLPSELAAPELSAPKFKMPEKLEPIEVFEADQIDRVEEMSQAMTGFGAIMNSVNQITAEGGAAWIGYAANVLNAVAMAIPQIMALTAVEEVEAQTKAKGAAAGAAKSVASIPIVGPIMAVAAIASVMAALTSLPKFKDGGIVAGGQVVGDKVPILVNSGEMVLNRNQQANLFDMLDKGGSSQPQVVMLNPRIRGTDIELALENVNKSRRR